MSEDLQDFEQFMQHRMEVARAYVGGDAGPLEEIVTRKAPATFFGPRGGSQQGPDAVVSSYKQGAAQFEPNGETRLEILQMGASDGIAFWTGLQHAAVRLRGQAEAVSMTLRITEVYRREEDAWKLVHRHADMPASAS